MPESPTILARRPVRRRGAVAAVAVAATGLLTAAGRAIDGGPNPAASGPSATTRPAATANATPTPPAPVSPPTAEEWMRLDRFMETTSPHKWAMYKELREAGGLKQRLRQQIIERYRILRRLENDDARRHEIEVQAIKIEDDIYGLLRAAGAGDPNAGDDSALRAKVDQLVQNRDAWRVERLQRVLGELEAIGGVREAVDPIRREIRRLADLGPAGRKVRVDNRVEEFKQRMRPDKRPRLGKPLSGGDRPPAASPDTRG